MVNARIDFSPESHDVLENALSMTQGNNIQIASKRAFGKKRKWFQVWEVNRNESGHLQILVRPVDMDGEPYGDPIAIDPYEVDKIIIP